MAWGSLLQLIPAAVQMGEGSKQRTEGAGSYDIRTGKYYDQRKFNQGRQNMSLLNPIKAAADPNVKGIEKVAAFSGWGFVFADKARKRKEAENARIGAMYTGISDKISGLTDYEISPEAQQRLAALEESGETMKGLTGEATDIARARTGQEAPGAQIARGDIRQAVAGKMSAIQQIGGAGALGAITEAGLEEQGALRGLAKENLEYKAQASKDLSNALMAEAQTGAQATQMGAAGLQGMVQERGKVYESQLNKALTSIDFDINTLATEQLGYQAQAQAQAATQAGMMSGLSQIGSSWLANKGSSGGTYSTSSPNNQPLYGANAPVTEGTQLNPSGNYGGLYNF